jgi:hypothetical protein
MKFSELTEQQQATIRPMWRKKNPNASIDEIEGEYETELWHYFLAAESDPEKVMSLYYSLFDPNHQARLDMLDKLWTIFNQLSPPNLDFWIANIYMMTDRLDGLNKLLQEYSHVLSKA